jgi:hypothetical protein
LVDCVGPGHIVVGVPRRVIWLVGNTWGLSVDAAEGLRVWLRDYGRAIVLGIVLLLRLCLVLISATVVRSRLRGGSSVAHEQLVVVHGIAVAPRAWVFVASSSLAGGVAIVSARRRLAVGGLVCWTRAGVGVRDIGVIVAMTVGKVRHDNGYALLEVSSLALLLLLEGWLRE